MHHALLFDCKMFISLHVWFTEQESTIKSALVQPKPRKKRKTEGDEMQQTGIVTTRSFMPTGWLFFYIYFKKKKLFHHSCYKYCNNNSNNNNNNQNVTLLATPAKKQQSKSRENVSNLGSLATSVSSPLDTSATIREEGISCSQALSCKKSVFFFHQGAEKQRKKSRAVRSSTGEDDDNCESKVGISHR